ncbi:hypothetical protein [Tahibacter amnicola]|uniref:EF-hand domain-containing protein n=1 Tax=Tahibacter amnicola TaxID=2976241 RepID=A0ABY6B9E5_9GAMM|nr:hypothetical protein [Tahibacter amnicola]UXI66494.1 hypothetical protein N4264_17290 [Tahibacter amnicola]
MTQYLRITPSLLFAGIALTMTAMAQQTPPAQHPATAPPVAQPPSRQDPVDTRTVPPSSNPPPAVSPPNPRQTPPIAGATPTGRNPVAPNQQLASRQDVRGTHSFVTLDSNTDGVLSLEEFKVSGNNMTDCDRDADGRITRNEFDACLR